MEQNNSCNFLLNDVKEVSEPEPRLTQQFKKIPNLFNTAVARVRYNFIRKMAHPGPGPTGNGSTNLEPGDWVEVKSLREIAQTLDSRGRNKGLYFMPEMEEFCGGKYKIFKKAAIIKLETTGELRKLRSPALFLEGVYCNGKYQGGCDRACFHFWRGEWLKRIPE